MSSAACQSLSKSTAAPADGMSVPRPQETGVMRHSRTGQSGCFKACKCVRTCVRACELGVPGGVPVCGGHLHRTAGILWRVV
eukprot:1152107-Pelagomonas_calceolata.AAC.4